jgi:hypothetical protein
MSSDSGKPAAHSAMSQAVKQGAADQLVPGHMLLASSASARIRHSHTGGGGGTDGWGGGGQLNADAGVMQT